MSDQAPVIALERVTAGYGGAPPVRELTLRVPRGAVYALLGPNGAGKTTAIRCLVGQLRPLAGRALLFGRDSWRDRADVLARAGFVPERPDAPPELTVRDLMTFGARVYPTWNADGLVERLARGGIGPGQRFGALSRGQCTQVALALALAPSPDVVILDEPTLGMDPETRRSFFGELIFDLADRGATVLLSTHDLDGVERIADHIGVMSQGRMLVEAPLEEFRAAHGGRPLDQILHEMFGGAR